MNLTKTIIAILTVLAMTGCAAITITASGPSDFTYRPDYEKTKHFFLWGLVGEHSVNTRAVCKERQVSQMQTKFSGYDVLFAGLTLGIYLPRTAKVWCEREEDPAV